MSGLHQTCQGRDAQPVGFITTWARVFLFFFFFLTVIFSVNNSSDAGSSPWSRAWGAWPLCLQFCCHFSCSLCRSCGNSLKCTNTYFSSPQNSVFHTIIVESMSTFTLRFYFSEVHNYKNLLQIQLSIHNCKYRCFQPIKTLGSLLFMPDVPLYLWCGLTAAQDTEHSSPVSICGCSKNWKGNSHCWKLPAGNENAYNCLCCGKKVHCFFAALRFRYPFIIQGLLGKA